MHHTFKGKYISRIELRVNGRAASFIMNKASWKKSELGEFYARSLTTNEGFYACLLAFQKTVECELKLSDLIKRDSVLYKSARSLALHKDILSYIDEERSIERVRQIQGEGRIPENIAREVLLALRRIRDSQKATEHAREVKHVLEQQIALMSKKFPPKYKLLK